MSTYTIEFGPFQTSASEQVNLDESSLRPQGWRFIGNPEGVNFLNKTNSTFGNLYIRTNYPEDRFVLPSTALGGVFEEVWSSKDGSQLVFRGAEIPPGEKFWMRVPPTPPCQTNECDTFGKCPFDGQININFVPCEPEWFKYNI